MKGDFSRDTFDPVKHFRRVLQQQGRVQLDADANEQTAILLHYIQTLAADLIGPFGGPEIGSGFQIGAFDSQTKDFSISKGRYYVDGILCENDADTTYKEQKDYLNPPDEFDEKGHYLVYLDVWERHITALEDDYIREKALGGPDTATRTKVICQVKVEKNEQLVQLDCATIRNYWDKDWKIRWQPDNRGLLKVRVTPQKNSSDPCLTAPDAKYRGQENQLYRIEIHKEGKAGEPDNATFKWSRDNGAVVSKVLSSLGKELKVERTLGFEPKIWVELSNNEQELRGEPGILAKLLKIDGDRFVFESEIEQLKPKKIKNEEIWPTKVRRWDQRYNSDLKEGAIPIKEREGDGEKETDWITIENGIEIQFVPATDGDPHHYRTGDYWLIPARVATGDIEWPIETGLDGKPVLIDGNKSPGKKEPFGIQHHYAPLAILNTGSGELPDCCRCLFDRIDSSCNRADS